MENLEESIKNYIVLVKPDAPEGYMSQLRQNLEKKGFTIKREFTLIKGYEIGYKMPQELNQTEKKEYLEKEASAIGEIRSLDYIESLEENPEKKAL